MIVRQGLIDIFKNSDGALVEEDTTPDQDVEKASNQTRTSETFLGVPFHSHIQGFSLQILESLVNNEKYLVRSLGSGDSYSKLKLIVKNFWEKTDDWCLFRT
mmetsp:Transcript_6427/g.10387  ORF Transcript_6427/g.10387 Transcript_6427/m.10387 type:complete len:102 (-) Transcript_6427:881-1186(-)